MAPRKSIQNKSSPSTPSTKVFDLIRDCNIPSSVCIRPLTEAEEKKWRVEGLDSGLLVLGKRHIETISFPLHPMILQILSVLQVHPMQLTPNSLKCIVATIILNEVEKKNITVEDFFFVYKVVKTPTSPKAPPKQFMTFYLSTKKYHMYSRKLALDKDWESVGRLFMVSGDWMSPYFNNYAFPLVNKFTCRKFYCCYAFFFFYYFCF